MNSNICEVLLALVGKYRHNIPAMPYCQETGAIKNLMQDLKLEANAAHIQTLFAGHWMSVLRTASEQFEQMMFTRSDATSEATMDAAKVAHEAAQMTFGKLCEMVNALAIVNGDAAYFLKDIGGLETNRINQLVAELHNVVACRRSCKKSDETADSDSSTDTPAPSPVEE